MFFLSFPFQKQGYETESRKCILDCVFKNISPKRVIPGKCSNIVYSCFKNASIFTKQIPKVNIFNLFYGENQKVFWNLFRSDTKQAKFHLVQPVIDTNIFSRMENNLNSINIMGTQGLQLNQSFDTMLDFSIFLNA